MHPEKTIIQKDTCTPMLTAAQFTIAKTWKQPKCPSTDEWIKRRCGVYTTPPNTHNGLSLSHKKEGNNAICCNMDGPRDYHIKWSSQTEKDKYHMIALICGI